MNTFLLRYRLPLILFLNVLLTILSYALALDLRFEFIRTDWLTVERFFEPLIFLLIFRLGAYAFFNLYRGYWRYSSTHDLLAILKAHATSSLLFMASVMFFRIHGFPRSVIFIELALSILLCGGSRFLVRILCERWLGNKASDLLAQPVIVLGAGDSGHLLVRQLQTQKRIPYTPVFVLDDSERLINSLVHGVRVVGPLSYLEKILQKHSDIAAVISAIPSLSKTRLELLSKLCLQYNIPFKKLQSFEEIAISNQLGIEEPSMESVLQKQITVEHEDEIRNALRGRRILITGAGGSIGSELARQILSFSPSALILFDHSEFNLFKIQCELSSQEPKVNKHFILGNICNQHRLNSIFRDLHPEIVFHAAAYKHVPMMEDNCFEAFINNIIGTRNVLEACLTQQVLHFVLISTDKAVDPSSVMGCSKRIAELLVAEYTYSSHQNGNGSAKLQSAVVRFGNVINSAGSVIPLFKEQILSGGPLTVTHPEMERFFMSIREAVRLVLTAGILGRKGKVYVLDMGKPIKIVDLAKKMLALYGRKDIPIVFTGMRPGEKLTEELTSSREIIEPTNFAKVYRVINHVEDNSLFLSNWVKKVESQITQLNNDEIRDLLLGYIANLEQSPQEYAVG